MKTRLFVVFTLALLLVIAISGCAGATTGTKLKVGLVTDVGGVNDKSFNQSAWEGVQLAEKELGAKVQYIETTDAKDYAKNIGTFGDAGYDVIVTVGFALGEATAAAAATYPDVDFIGVDQFQAETTEGVAGLNFPEESPLRRVSGGLQRAS